MLTLTLSVLVTEVQQTSDQPISMIYLVEYIYNYNNSNVTYITSFQGPGYYSILFPVLNHTTSSSSVTLSLEIQFWVFYGSTSPFSFLQSLCTLSYLPPKVRPSSTHFLFLSLPNRLLITRHYPSIVCILVYPETFRTTLTLKVGESVSVTF